MPRRILAAIALAATSATFGFALAPQAQADAPISVTTTLDVVDARDGLTSLREATTRANTRAGRDVIQLAPGARYRLTICRAGDENANASGDLDATDAAGTSISGRGAVIENTCAGQRVLTTQGPSSLEWTTVRGGHAQGEGGAIHAHDLTLVNSTVENSDATASGGGIRVTGELVLHTSRVRSNRAAGWGGGIAVDGFSYFIRSRVENNTAAVAGGVAASDALLLMEGSVSANVATADIGGIFSTGNVAVSQSTVAANRGVWTGGISSVGETSLNYSTVVDNSVTQAGTANISSDSLAAFGSIVALPAGPAGTVSCRPGAVTSNGYNFDGDATCRLRDATDIARAGNPSLGVLIGGYKVPNAGSPAVDRIPANHQNCGFWDQRGLARPRGNGCDIGAIER